MTTSFYGHPLSYWMELKRRLVDNCGVTGGELLDEIVALQGKVAFYEERIKQMARLVGKDDA